MSGGFRALALGLEGRLGELSATTVERLRMELPIWASAEAIGEEGVVAFVRASLTAQVRSFRHRALPDHCPRVTPTGRGRSPGSAT